MLQVIDDDPEFMWAVFQSILGHLHLDPSGAPRWVAHVRERWLRLTGYERTMLILYEAWIDTAWGRALEAARELEQIQPYDSQVRYMRAKFAIRLGEYGEAVEALEDVDELILPQHRLPRIWTALQLAFVYQRLGRHEDMAALARRLGTEMPSETDLVLIEVEALAAMGAHDELAAVVGRCEALPHSQCNADWVRWRASWSLAAYGHPEAGRELALSKIGEYRNRLDAEGFGSGRCFPFSVAAEDAEPGADRYLLNAYHAAGLWEEYLDLARRRSARFERTMGESSAEYMCSQRDVAIAAAHTGDRATAEAILLSFENSGGYYFAGMVAAHLGELDRAVGNLAKDDRLQSVPIQYIYRRWDLLLEPLWGYPPFERLIDPQY
jgi:hypothetical protein